MLYFGDTEF